MAISLAHGVAIYLPVYCSAQKCASWMVGMLKKLDYEATTRLKLNFTNEGTWNILQIISPVARAML